MAGAGSLAGVACIGGEAINSAWLVLAAVCTYLAAYRFYGAFIAAKVLALDDNRATPSERLRNGHDFEPTNKWIVFGHHFAAIAGPGPLGGPTLAAQFGYLPGTLWIIIGVVIGGAVQDFIILFSSVRRNGKSLGQMAREEYWQNRRRDGAAHRPADHDHPAGRHRLGRRQRAQRQSLGDVHYCRHHADRRLHGSLPALLAARQGPGSLPHRLRPGGGQHLYRRMGGGPRSPGAVVHAERHGARHLCDRLWLLRQRTACLAVAGAARLPLDVRQTRCRPDAGRGHPVCPARIADARADSFHRRNRAYLRRNHLSVLLHHHRLWGDLRFPCIDQFRDDAQDDRQGRAHSPGRIRFDAA